MLIDKIQRTKKKASVKDELVHCSCVNLCALLYIITAVVGLQDEGPMSCLGYRVSWFLALAGLHFTSVVNPSMCFTFSESY